MKKSVSTQQTATNIAVILELLTDTPGKLEALSKDLSENQLRAPLGVGERSFAESLAHLIHSEARSSEAIILALLANEPTFVDIHSERQFGKLMQFHQFPFSELLAYFKLRRTALLRVLARLTEAQWSRCIREEGRKRRESVYWRARSMAMHELEHLSDLEARLGKLEIAHKIS